MLVSGWARLGWSRQGDGRKRAARHESWEGAARGERKEARGEGRVSERACDRAGRDEGYSSIGVS